jgi:hypothetical protein
MRALGTALRSAPLTPLVIVCHLLLVSTTASRRCGAARRRASRLKAKASAPASQIIASPRQLAIVKRRRLAANEAARLAACGCPDCARLLSRSVAAGRPYTYDRTTRVPPVCIVCHSASKIIRMMMMSFSCSRAAAAASVSIGRHH